MKISTIFLLVGALCISQRAEAATDLATFKPHLVQALTMYLNFNQGLMTAHAVDTTTVTFPPSTAPHQLCSVSPTAFSCSLPASEALGKRYLLQLKTSFKKDPALRVPGGRPSIVANGPNKYKVEYTEGTHIPFEFHFDVSPGLMRRILQRLVLLKLAQELQA